MTDFKYFKPAEFHFCSPDCSINQVSEKLLSMLDLARELYGLPIVINSAYRSPEWERIHKRSGTSSHCKGLAVDISCLVGPMRLRLIEALLDAGFKRIGIAKSYIHVDIDDSKPDSLWLY